MSKELEELWRKEVFEAAQVDINEANDSLRALRLPELNEVQEQIRQAGFYHGALWQRSRAAATPATGQGMKEASLNEITEVMREADNHFETVGGGGTRHYLRDCFLPLLKEKGFAIVYQAPSDKEPSIQMESFQYRVDKWLLACFGEEISRDKVERNHRFLEEALELVQSLGCTESEALQLVHYVFGREVGEVKQETGGVMVTLAALCLASEIDMNECGETELSRIWTKVEKIREKQANKPKHSPLPESTSVKSDKEIEELAEEHINKLQYELVFAFSSFHNWVNKAKNYFARYQKWTGDCSEKIICLDVNGNALTLGEDFSIAESKNLFPVKCYRLIRTSEVNK
jgi:hypothetical protein